MGLREDLGLLTYSPDPHRVSARSFLVVNTQSNSDLLESQVRYAFYIVTSVQTAHHTEEK